jgi:hypothetical protein
MAQSYIERLFPSILFAHLAQELETHVLVMDTSGTVFGEFGTLHGSTLPRTLRIPALGVSIVCTTSRRPIGDVLTRVKDVVRCWTIAVKEVEELITRVGDLNEQMELLRTVLQPGDAAATTYTGVLRALVDTNGLSGAFLFVTGYRSPEAIEHLRLIASTRHKHPGRYVRAPRLARAAVDGEIRVLSARRVDDTLPLLSSDSSVAVFMRSYFGLRVTVMLCCGADWRALRARVYGKATENRLLLDALCVAASRDIRWMLTHRSDVCDLCFPLPLREEVQSACEGLCRLSTGSARRQLVAVNSEIASFFRAAKSGEAPLPQLVLELIESLWRRVPGISSSRGYVRQFGQEEILLFESPKYRDHLIHQMQVFLLGLVFIGKVPAVRRHLRTAYGEQLTAMQMLQTWLITATFHDAMYHIDKASEWVNGFLRRLLAVQSPLIQFELQLGMTQLASEEPYASLLNEVAAYHTWLTDVGRKDRAYWKRTLHTRFPVYRNLLMGHMLSNADHGVLSALLLTSLVVCKPNAVLDVSKMLRRLRDGSTFRRYVMAPAAAISMHNHMWGDYRTKKGRRSQPVVKTTLAHHPLGFLLALCDAVHEWGRPGDASLGFVGPQPQLTALEAGRDGVRMTLKLEQTGVRAAEKWVSGKMAELRWLRGALQAADCDCVLSIEPCGAHGRRRRISIA